MQVLTFDSYLHAQPTALNFIKQRVSYWLALLAGVPAYFRSSTPELSSGLDPYMRTNIRSPLTDASTFVVHSSVLQPKEETFPLCFRKPLLLS